jgi:hypothetical protein
MVDVKVDKQLAFSSVAPTGSSEVLYFAHSLGRFCGERGHCSRTQRGEAPD